MTKLDLALGQVPPHEDAVKFKDSIHTGGVWLYKGLIWKPLDCRPYPNSTFRVRTNEWKCLQEMAGRPLFPKNWTIYKANGRDWLVRHELKEIPNDESGGWWTMLLANQVENAVRDLNEHGWELGDDIQLLFDENCYQPILSDLSNVHKNTKTVSGCYAPNDLWRVRKWFKQIGMKAYADLQQKAIHAAGVFHVVHGHSSYRYVYLWEYPDSGLGEERLPVPGGFGDIDYEVFSKNDPENDTGMTWVLSREPITDKWGFGSIAYLMQLDKPLQYRFYPTHSKVLARCKDKTCCQNVSVYTKEDMVYAGGLPYCEYCDGEQDTIGIQTPEWTYYTDGSKERTLPW